MWKALQSYDPARGSLPAYLTLKANSRMKDVLRNLNSSRGSNNEITHESESPVWASLEAELEETYFENGVGAYLKILTKRQQEYVFLRFQMGMTPTQMNKHFGYDPTGLWRQAKRKLKEAVSEGSS
jgi:DNA-directed RNA polymerase specialized sigma24 family protein